jgi:hypothetical protein
MAVPYIGHLRARLRARFHVQVRVSPPPTEFRTPAVVPVGGRVVRVFRGGGAVRVGDEVRFAVPVCRQGDPIWPGYEFAWYDDFMRTTHLEVYLDGEPPACEVALDEWVAINGPSYVPRLRASRLIYLVQLIRWRRAPRLGW